MLALVHHKQLYFQDGSAIFQVENVLYKLHMSLLQPNSIVLNTMFTMPEGEGQQSQKEWLDNENPIQLDAPFTVKKFDNLLFCVCTNVSRRNPQFPPLDALKDILELATFLVMEIAHSFAIQALASLTLSLSPATHLSLAISFRIGDWIKPAFQEVITCEPYELRGFHTAGAAGDVPDYGNPGSHLFASSRGCIQSIEASQS
ncbi:hypothetical protein K439DRAFT_1617426 [Ramaria rubella]|nr:hypothetical protein K439DRAFT_1617426 [Ramaria rubella]